MTIESKNFFYRQILVLKNYLLLCFVVDSFVFMSSCFHPKLVEFVDKKAKISFLIFKTMRQGFQRFSYRNLRIINLRKFRQFCNFLDVFLKKIAIF